MLGDGELDDGEQRRLAEIESSLRADDPDFVQRFEQGRLRRKSCGRSTLVLLAVSVAVVVIVVALVYGSVGDAVVGLFAEGTAVGLWASRHDA
jgi:Protein of unknown function (DUF3040)